MSREAIENTISTMRDRNAVANLRRGIVGNVSVNSVRRAEDICEMFAGRIEADVADILAENERLKKELAETKEALKPIDDVYIPDYGICDTCYDRSECEGPENSVTCEWHDIVEAVKKTKRIIGGWSWTRITEKG